MREPEKSVRYLADRMAIQDLVHNYNLALDLREDGLIDSLFTVDAVNGDKVGIDAIHEAYRRTWEKFTELHHMSTNLVVEIDGDRASARSKSIVLRGGSELETAEFPIYVVYDDDLVRVNGAWRIQRRRFAGYPHPIPAQAPIAAGTDQRK